MASEYSLSDVLARIYHNQLALEAAIMELTLLAEALGAAGAGAGAGGNVRVALETIGENAGFINQGLARLKKLDNG